MHHLNFSEHTRKLVVCWEVAVALSLWATCASGESKVVEVVVTFQSSEITREPAFSNGNIQIATESKSASIASLSTALSCSPVCRDRLAPQFAIEGPWLIALYTDEDPEVLLAGIRSEPLIAWAELEVTESGVAFEATTARFPDPNVDLFCPSQPQLHRRVNGEAVLPGSNCNQVAAGIDHDMDLPQAWGVCEGDTSVVVAVIDVGFDFVHPGLPLVS